MRHGVSNPCHVISLSVDPVTSSSSLSPVFLAYSDGSLVAAADITVCRTAAREQITRKVIHSEYSQNLERGTIAQNVPSHILSCFKIPSIRLFAMQIMQCIKMHYNLRTMNPSLPTPKLRHCRPIHRFPKVHVHLQCPSSHQFRRIFQRFPDKNVVQKFSQTRNFKPKIIFAGRMKPSRFPSREGYCIPHPTSCPNQPSGSTHTTPRIAVRLTPLDCGHFASLDLQAPGSSRPTG